uniref:DDE Tnp4 domain-containing protein n=1 Tax=Romanomermis culicivorax TaxID=13658 RepID=A0A915LB43_ROMCU
MDCDTHWSCQDKAVGFLDKELPFSLQTSLLLSLLPLEGMISDRGFLGGALAVPPLANDGHRKPKLIIKERRSQTARYLRSFEWVEMATENKKSSKKCPWVQKTINGQTYCSIDIGSMCLKTLEFER